MLQFGFILVGVDQLTQVTEITNDWTDELDSCRTHIEASVNASRPILQSETKEVNWWCSYQQVWWVCAGLQHLLQVLVGSPQVSKNRPHIISVYQERPAVPDNTGPSRLKCSDCGGTDYFLVQVDQLIHAGLQMYLSSLWFCRIYSSVRLIWTWSRCLLLWSVLVDL